MTQLIEGTDFSLNTYYAGISHLTNGNQLKKMQDGVKWHTLTKQHPVKEIFFTQHPKTKFMNPYTMLAAMIIVPENDTVYQLGKPGDTTIETCVLDVSFQYRYLEHNHEFNHALQ